LQVFLDCDGVLADFNTKAIDVCGGLPHDANSHEENSRLWDIIGQCPDFFFGIEKLPDADELVAGVRELGFEPVILTGVPRFKESVGQKLRWGQKHFPSLKMITCRSREKYLHGQPGDVLIDDWGKYQSAWTHMGGIFILHKNTQQSLAELKRSIER
jgi:hypothetical protein